LALQWVPRLVLQWVPRLALQWVPRLVLQWVPRLVLLVPQYRKGSKCSIAVECTRYQSIRRQLSLHPQLSLLHK